MNGQKKDEMTIELDNPVADSGEQSLDQIREILFGSQSRDIDARFDDLSQHVAKSLEDVGSLIRKRCDALTQRLDNEVQKLWDELHKAQHENRGGHAELASQQQATANSLGEQIASLSATLAAAEQNLRGQSDLGINALREQLASEIETLRSQLERSVDQVAKSSVTRRSFGELLRELSARLDEN